MPTTLSPTSSRHSGELSRKGLIVWLSLSTILVGLGFLGQASGESDPDLFYNYGLAVSSVIVYGIIVGITVWAATGYGDAVDALGLRSLPFKWIGIAVGLIFLVLGLAFVLEPILHAGEEQGYAPDVWRPDRATAFFVNGAVAATLVPFSEELFFRGLGVRVLSFLGGAWAILGTAVVFGLGHGLLVAMPVFIAFGVALGWVRLRSDSVWPGVVAHGLFNALALVALYADLQQ
jgi:membrane protease YdiL (CAAX protease family)